MSSLDNVNFFVLNYETIKIELVRIQMEQTQTLTKVSYSKLPNFHLF
jgi:hypothetical protein